MRTHYHLQERHLLESVQRKIITHEQMEAILALARSMAPTETGPAPDAGWVTVIQGTVTVLVLGGIALGHFMNLHHYAPWTILALSALYFALSLSAAIYLRRRTGGLRQIGALFAAGAAMFTWGLGAGLWAAVQSPRAFGLWEYAESYNSITMARLEAYLAGDATVVLMALVLGLKLNVPATASVGSVAFIHLVMGSAERWHLAHGGDFLPAAAQVPVLLLLGATMLAIASLIDWRWKSSYDPAFWIHLSGLAVLGTAAVIRIDTNPPEGLLWIALTIFVIVMGVHWQRWPYLIAGAVGLLVLPCITIAESHFPRPAPLVSLVLSLVVVALGATWFHRYRLRQWLQNPTAQTDRTVWG